MGDVDIAAGQSRAGLRCERERASVSESRPTGRGSVRRGCSLVQSKKPRRPQVQRMGRAGGEQRGRQALGPIERRLNDTVDEFKASDEVLERCHAFSRCQCFLGAGCTAVEADARGETIGE